MKRIISLALLPLMLTACGSDEYVHSSEPRSNVYFGQPVADLYENFGSPTKASRLSEDKRILIYVKQEIEKEWAYRYVRGCVMKFYLKNERVVAWSANGQACVIPSTGGNITMFNQQFQNMKFSTDGFGSYDTTKYSPTGGKVPDDAFDGLADTHYGAIHDTKMYRVVDKNSNIYQLPADAFEGVAPTTYRSVKEPFNDNIASGVHTVPDDAFDGQASTIYRPTKKIIKTKANSSSASMLPTDAFDGKASTVYRQTPTQSEQRNSWFDSDEDWGLFDN